MKSPHRGRWLTGIFLLTVAGTGIGLSLAQPTPRFLRPVDANTIVAIVNDHTVRMTRDGVFYIVDPALLLSAGPAKDGIPSIDHPSYVSMDEADEWIADDELVLVLNYKGISRVYPLQILVWHNIVNDVVAGDPVLVSYCPLCGSAVAYERTLAGGSAEFGTSGKLYNSNFVLYDRLTDTLWSQFEGLALVGELAGQELSALPLDTVVWKDWKATHPDSQILSRETGFNQDYDHDPYGNYCEDSFVLLPMEGRAHQIPAKTVVLGIEVNGRYAAYREEDLIAHGSILDRIGGARISLSRDAAGIVSVLNLSTDQSIEKMRSYWFAWVSFHPTTTLNLFSGS
ncbi:DUF3179 domain-containing protein [Candidatus Bipolaricaulota bacterium]|nr:DUF3179 domain-containing protein [Candidatus Bipolaricaulota bacterium]